MQGFANKTGRVDNNGLRLEIHIPDKPLFVEVTARKVMIEYYVPQSYLDVASECRVLPWGPWLALPERSLGESEKHSRTKTLTHAVTLLYHIVHIYNSHCHMPLTSKFTEDQTNVREDRTLNILFTLATSYYPALSPSRPPSSDN